MTVNIAHLLFEQSGTFKKEFHMMGILALDYDIANDFGETDIRVDLFSQIELAFLGKVSIFTDIRPADLIIAFFPCTYFCGNNTMFFDGTNIAWKNMDRIEILDKIIARADERNRYYTLALKLCAVCERLQLRCIIENPYNAHH